jgi:hypothetical protein
MADEFAPLNLRARLAALQDRIAQARAQLEAHGVTGDQVDELTHFVDQHDAIHSALDGEGTITELQHGKASAQTDALENALTRWLDSVESTFSNPPPRKPNASL